MPINTDKFKKILEEEKNTLETELSKVARQDPDNLSDWEPLPVDRDVSQADDNTVADSVEQYEDNSAITNTLVARYKDVRSGLDKIEKGVFGTCQVCKKEIDEERLNANPAARFCREHML
jgi:DnaK suppressor protein